jgi:hypothetical protein
MFTTARHSEWPLDRMIQELKGTGLPKDCLGRLGVLSDVDRAGAAHHMRQLLACVRQPRGLRKVHEECICEEDP